MRLIANIIALKKILRLTAKIIAFNYCDKTQWKVFLYTGINGLPYIGCRQREYFSAGVPVNKLRNHMLSSVINFFEQ